MKVFFTHSDLDGVGSIILNEYYNIKFDQIHILSYDDIEDEEGNFILKDNIKLNKNTDDVVVTDLSMKPQFYSWLKENSKSLIVFDHHDETSNITDDPNVTYDKHICGTKLYFKFLTKGKRVPVKVKEFVELVQTYDTYSDESLLWEEAQNLNRVFYKVYSWGLKPELAVQRFVRIQIGKIRSLISDNFDFTDYEKNIIEEVKEREQKIFEESKSKMKIRKDNAGNTFAVIIIASKVSIVCFMLLKAFPNIKYIIAINSFRGINGRVSVRADKGNDINVNNIEGIAGHEKAGGGSFTVQFLTDFYEDNKAFLPYNKADEVKA